MKAGETESQDYWTYHRIDECRVTTDCLLTIVLIVLIVLIIVVTVFIVFRVPIVPVPVSLPYPRIITIL